MEIKGRKMEIKIEDKNCKYDTKVAEGVFITSTVESVVENCQTFNIESKLPEEGQVDIDMVKIENTAFITFTLVEEIKFQFIINPDFTPEGILALKELSKNQFDTEIDDAVRMVSAPTVKDYMEKVLK